MKTLSHYLLSLRSILAVAIACGTMIVGNPMANAANVGALELIGVFSGSSSNTTGIATISTAIGLPTTLNLGDYLIGTVSARGGASNGFKVTPDTFLIPSRRRQPIAGTWEFNPAASSFTDIGYLVISALNRYGLYKVNYQEPFTETDIVQGLWTTDDLGRAARSYTAYATPQVPIPAADLLFGSALLLSALGCRSRRKL